MDSGGTGDASTERSMVKLRLSGTFDEAWWWTATTAGATARAAKARTAKLVGSNAGETIQGTASAELIDGRGGDDLLIGRGGDDTLKGGKGNDRLAGDGVVDLELRQKAIEWTGGNDALDGGPGNDVLDGGNGDDIVLGGTGDDYVFGGYGGRDVVDGGPGHDRLIGGFRGPGAPGWTDNDILIGGPGLDIFEARFWIQDRHLDVYPTRGLGPNQDLILDFKSGEDRLDVVLYRFDATTTFRRGGFELFDSNRDGVLDARDRLVEVVPVTAAGKTALSIQLNVGAALLEAGLVGAGELDAGPHIITLFDVTSLRPADFVPTRTYTFLSGNGSLTGGSADEWLYGGSGSHTLRGNGGNDLYWGRGGRDTLVVGQGHDEIMDFVRGEDKLEIILANGRKIGFADLDTNRNGRLDDGDAAVSIRIEQMLAPGEIPTVGPATFIDLSLFPGGAGSSVLLYHAVGLGPTDFA